MGCWGIWCSQCLYTCLHCNKGTFILWFVSLQPASVYWMLMRVEASDIEWHVVIMVRVRCIGSSLYWQLPTLQKGWMRSFWKDRPPLTMWTQHDAFNDCNIQHSWLMISNKLALRLIYNWVSTPPSLGQPWLHTNISNVPSKNGNGESRLYIWDSR